MRHRLFQILPLLIAGMATTLTAPGVSAQAAPASPAAAPANQPPVPRYEAKRTSTPITIDGRIDEAAWQAAPTVALQFLWDSQTGAKQPTAARLLWDDQNLYVSYDVTDADINAIYLNRDDPTYQDDAVEIFINPRPTQIALYYGFEMNVRGVLYDYLAGAEGTILFKHYDATDVRIGVTMNGTMNERADQDRGWQLEVAIPWANFQALGRRPQVGAVWTMNLNRWDGVAPARRMSIWSDPLVERAHPHFPARFGELVFVE